MTNNFENSNRKSNVFSHIIQALKNDLVVVFVFAVIAFLFYFYAINIDSLLANICFAFPISFLLIIISAYLTNKHALSKKNSIFIQIGMGIVGLVLGTVVRMNFFPYGDIAYCGLACALISYIVYLFYPSEQENSYFANLFKFFLLSIFVSLLLFAGFSLLIFTIDLLFRVGSGLGEAFLTAFSFCAYIVFIPLFSYFLFYHRTDSSTKLTKLVFLYLLFPIFCLFILVLYAYFFIAVMSLSLPSNEINMVVSLATVLYLVFYCILQEHRTTKIAKWFYRLGVFIMMPLIILQIISVAIRISTYGLTPARVSSVAFILFSVMSLILIAIKNGQYFKSCLLVLAVLVLIVTISPLNMYDVSYISQVNRLKSMLTKFGMLENGKLVNHDREKLDNILTSHDKSMLISATSFITGYDYYHKGLPAFLEGYDNDPYQFYGFSDNLYDYSGKFELYYNHFEFLDYTEQVVDISQHNKLFFFSKYEYIGMERIAIEIDGEEYNITDFLLSLNDTDKHTQIIYELDSISFVFSEISFTYNDKDKHFSHYRISGCALKK